MAAWRTSGSPSDKGDFASARQEMRNVLAVEVVPHYRTLAEGQLEDMADEP